MHGFLRGFLWLFLLTSFTEKRTACALPLFLCPECKAGSHKIHQIRDFKNSSNTEDNKKHLYDDGIIVSIPPKTSIFQIVFLL